MAAPISKCQQIFSDIHNDLLAPGFDFHLVKGKYFYMHYGWDGLDDRGWGCGYRTLQSLCSWLKLQKDTSCSNLPPTVPSIPELQEALVAMEDKPPTVPSIPELQEALVAMEDKPQKFKGSKDWIGSFEVCLCLDYFYDVPCKILHVNSGKELPSQLPSLVSHFNECGSPIMMGGDSDNSSKGVLGVCTEPEALLIMDPHYFGPTQTVKYLQSEGWIKWCLIDDFKENSFYNLCLPQLKCKVDR